MKKMIVLSFLLISSLAVANQDDLKKQLFESDVHPFLTKTCATCHSEKATKPIGPAHSHSKSESAFIEFDKRMRFDKVARSSMWRVGTNGHSCKEFDVNCDNLEQINSDFKSILTKYVDDIEKAFPKDSKDEVKNAIVIDGEFTKLEIEVAKDVKDQPIKAFVTLKRLRDTDYVILEDLRIQAEEGFFELEGLEVLVNSKPLNKKTGFEDLKRTFVFSNENGITKANKDFDFRRGSKFYGQLMGPFNPMFRFSIEDIISIRLKSLKQLKKVRSPICDLISIRYDDEMLLQAQISSAEFKKDKLKLIDQTRYALSTYSVANYFSGRVASRPKCELISLVYDFQEPLSSIILSKHTDDSSQSELLDFAYYFSSIFEKYSSFIRTNEESVFAELIQENEEEGSYVYSDPKVQRGQHLYKTAGCINCHGGDLSGGLKLQTPGGIFSTPNISFEEVTGIGKWSLQNFRKAMREGEAPDGSTYFAAFPYTTYRNMKDQDIEALYEYIKIRPPQFKVVKEHDLALKARIPFAKSIWRALDEPPRFITELLKEDSSKAKGAYNVAAVTHCAECHTPRTTLSHLDYDKWMQGGSILDKNGRETAVPGLTNISKKGWTVESYKKFLRTGEDHKGTYADGKMAEVIENQTSNLTDEELNNIVEYLMSL